MFIILWKYCGIYVGSLEGYPVINWLSTNHTQTKRMLFQILNIVIHNYRIYYLSTHSKFSSADER